MQEGVAPQDRWALELANFRAERTKAAKEAKAQQFRDKKDTSARQDSDGPGEAAVVAELAEAEQAEAEQEYQCAAGSEVSGEAAEEDHRAAPAAGSDLSGEAATGLSPNAPALAPGAAAVASRIAAATPVASESRSAPATRAHCVRFIFEWWNQTSSQHTIQ